LKDFERNLNRTNSALFSELCFCLLTPQSKAVHCDKAIRHLVMSGLLFKGDEDEISKKIRGLVRFHNKKSRFIVEARKTLTSNKKLDIKKILKKGDVKNVREWLVANIKGLGYKEGSHFLRNVGLGADLAILDTHILSNLKDLGIIKEVPPSGSIKKYLETEDRMRKFAEKIKIPLEELDLLFWSNETGFIFK